MTRASDVAKILKQPFTNTLGTSNYRAGVNAGDSIASGGNYNVAIGDEAGTALTTGDNNVAIGFEALKAEDGHGDNVAIGYQALKALNAGGDSHNVAVGYQAGKAFTTGQLNSVIGSLSGTALTEAGRNTAVGYSTLATDTQGGRSTAIGYGALSTQNFSSATNSNNTAVGHAAGAALTTGLQNTFIGSEAGDAFTDADFNVAIGYSALTSDTQGSKSTAVGRGALNQQNFSSATDAQNTAVGYQAGATISTGQNNTLVGSLTGDGITTGDRNTALGYRSLSGAVDDGQYNTCVGSDAGLVTTGSQNTFVGAYDPSTGGSGAEITSGSNNTILGSFNGNQNSLDIRATSNHIVLSDGDGNPDFFKNNGSGVMGTWFTGNRTNSTYWPKTATNSSQHGVSLDGEAGQIGATSDGIPLYLNRNDSDGVIIVFYAQGNNEGNISVSGTTVSYNGGHLSRWSQLSDGSKDTTILKGTVMTNLDQMCVWSHDAIAVGDEIKNACGETIIATANDAKDAYTEDNEQLNCMAVSSVEGDVNVAGVFVNWDYIDDGFNDMNIAMTGDMVIRIAKGTTVARGDLLMSAGDGTAKPQGDDIVRSKTIAKVTSTNVPHTYDDGSYLVPCVLMAC